MNPHEQITSEIVDGCVVIKLIGEIDQHVVKRIRGAAHELVDAAANGPVTIDLSSVTFLDSAGIGLVVGIFKRTLVSLGPLVVTGASAGIRRVLSSTGLDTVLKISDD